LINTSNTISSGKPWTAFVRKRRGASLPAAVQSLWDAIAPSSWLPPPSRKEDSQRFLFGFGLQRSFTSVQKMTDSQQLLVEYAKNGSESAFREVVSRYSNLVYSTALRLVSGDTHLAEDVAQTVFMGLASKGRALSTEVMLGGWLHQHTYHVATMTLRADRRRQSREREAMEMNTLQDDSGANWREVAPILDEAITQLGSEDRTAILLRFFEQRDFRSVGEALGSDEDAARMRVNRALEKLHSLLKHRGVSLSVAALGTALTTEAVTAAPAGFAASVAGTALAGAAAGGGITATTIATSTTMNWINAKAIAAVVASALIAGTTTYVVEHRVSEFLRTQNAALREQNNRLAEVKEPQVTKERLPAQVKAEASRPESEHLELLRLRGQVGSLQSAAQENPRLHAQIDELTQKLKQAEGDRVEEWPKDPELRLATFKTILSRIWGNAVLNFAKQNDGQMPGTLTAAAPYLVQQFDAQARTNGVSIDQFELVYHGSVKGIEDPSRIILMREKQPVHLASGRWSRIYVYANGDVNGRGSDTEDFTAAEKVPR
jgi:RNA polymerase sigma factor (sigma-70 family)